MATTSPDTLRSPNPSDPYNLVADWAISMSDVQAALVRRANMYVGTAAQRIAASSVPEGVHWQDTDSTRREYVRRGSAWRGVAPLSGVETLTPPAGGGQVTSNISFPAGYFEAAPRVVATAQTGAGVTVTLNISVASITATGAVLNLNRSNNTATTITWVAVPA